MIDVRITGGEGECRPVKTTSMNELLTSPSLLPNEFGLRPFQLYTDFLMTSAGAFNMNVNGATTNQFFSVNAKQNFDLYIKTIFFIIADAGADLNEFGAVAALTNGCQFNYFTTKNGTNTIDVLKTNFDMIRLCGAQPAFGDSLTAFKAPNVAGQSEAYLGQLDFTLVYGFPFGIVLRKGSKDKLEIVIRDNLSALDQFTAKAKGFLV